MRKLNKSSTGVKRWLDSDAAEVKRDLAPPYPPYTQFVCSRFLKVSHQVVQAQFVITLLNSLPINVNSILN